MRPAGTSLKHKQADSDMFGVPWRETDGSRSGWDSSRPTKPHKRVTPFQPLLVQAAPTIYMSYCWGLSVQAQIRPELLGFKMVLIRRARLSKICQQMRLSQYLGLGDGHWKRGHKLQPCPHLIADDKVLGVCERGQHARDGGQVVCVDDALLRAHKLRQARLPSAATLT